MMLAMNDFKDFNIILINLDGLRQDRINYCPTLSSLRDSSYYFSEMKTAAPYTFASLHAVFSGMYPSKNGVNAYYNILKYNQDFTTIPQLLKKYNYYTSCDVISTSVIPKQGIDDWNVFDEETVDFKQRHTDMIRKLSKKKKFFLFLHYTETHKNLVREIVQKYKNQDSDDYFNSKNENEKRYNSYLPSCDDYVKSIMDTLLECKLNEKTILIFFSDHGTSIGEKKGEKFYGVFTYDYTVNVFCILHIPKTMPKLIRQQCSTIDIFSTIAEIAGKSLDDLQDIQGETLFNLLDNPNSLDREVFVETGGLYGPWPSPKKHNVFCVRTKKIN